MQRATGVGGMPAVDPTGADDEGEAEAEEQCEECVRCRQSECVCEAEAEEQCEECVGCEQRECVCEVVWREASEAEEEDGEVAHAFEEVPGSHRPPHPEYMSSGPVAPLGAPGFTGADGNGGDGSGGGGGGLGDVGVLGGGGVSGVRGGRV